MAKKLNSTYGFSYDKLKVLLGGWNTWKQENDKDPGSYPIETGPGTRLGQQLGDSGNTGSKSSQPGAAVTTEIKQPGTGNATPTVAPAMTP